MKYYTKACKLAGVKTIKAFDLNHHYPGENGLYTQLKREDPESIVLLCSIELAKRTYLKLREQGLNQTVFLTSSLLYSSDFYEILLQDEKDVYTIQPEQNQENLYNAFENNFYKRFRYKPAATAAYAYDGMKALIKAIEEGGLDRDNIKRALSGLKLESAVTGSFGFQENGNRQGVIEVKKLTY